MIEKKERAPFKSGVSDFTAIRKRMEEIGIRGPVVGGENGVSVEKQPETPPEASHYVGYVGY